MATSSSSSLQCPLLPPNSRLKLKLKLKHPSFLSPPPARSKHFQTVAFRREDFDSFKKRVVSGEVWRDAWRGANQGFEEFIYEARKATERLDRRYSISRRLSSAADSASLRARQLDRDFQLSYKWRSFSLDFSRNLPRYRKQLGDFLDTPFGKSSVTIFFIWFALSGWLFRSLLIATWVLPLAGPLLLGAVTNNLVVKGACPSCRREFIGSKSSVIRCAGCGNIVWQPQGDFFSSGNKGSSRSKSEPEIIDVEFEEK